MYSWNLLHSDSFISLLLGHSAVYLVEPPDDPNLLVRPPGGDLRQGTTYKARFLGIPSVKAMLTPAYINAETVTRTASCMIC
jgi:hypothetical protein